MANRTKEEVIEIVQNREIDIQELFELVQSFHPDPQVESAVAMHLSIRFKADENVQNMSQKETLAEIFKLLSKSQDMSSRWAAAKSPFTPLSTLEKLCEDSVNLVRALCATNKNTPQKYLERFYHDEKIVKDGLSGNPSVPPTMLHKLADEADKMVRLRVSENPSTSKETLEKLAQDKEKDVKIAAKIHLEKRYV